MLGPGEEVDHDSNVFTEAVTGNSEDSVTWTSSNERDRSDAWRVRRADPNQMRSSSEMGGPHDSPQFVKNGGRSGAPDAHRFDSANLQPEVTLFCSLFPFWLYAGTSARSCSSAASALGHH
jgi:hypothetical protein